MGGFIVNNQFTYSAYNDYGLGYNYPSSQDDFIQNDYRLEDQEYLANIANTWQYQNIDMAPVDSRWFAPVDNAGIQWEADIDEDQLISSDRNRVGDRVRVNQGVRTWATGEGMPSWVHGQVYPVIETRTRNGVTELLLGSGINSWIRQTDVTTVSGTPTPVIRVNDRVRVNRGVRTWATGEGMPSWVHGRVYPVIEIRTRSGVTELLLGEGINSWIRRSDVTRVSGTTAPPTTAPPAAAPPVTTPPTTPTATVRVNDRVRVKQGTNTWATGEGMPSWVHGRVYPVIEIRTRNGITELLLGSGINSWIRSTDVVKVSTTTPIRVNDRVRVNRGVGTWATGEGMPSWVHGRVYPVIEIRTRNGATELLLGDGINSWIRRADVTRV